MGMGWYPGIEYRAAHCTVLIRIWRRHPEQAECWCEDGWGRLPGSSKCSQQSTQASCPEGQIVREAGRCSYLPADINSQLYRYSSWLHKTGHSWGCEGGWKWEISAGEGKTQILVVNFNLKLCRDRVCVSNCEISPCFKVFQGWTQI